MPDCEIAERHGRCEREAGLIADAVLGGRCDIAGRVEPGDRPPPLMDDLAIVVGEEADGSGAGRMQLDAIERRLLNGAEASIAAARRLRGSKLPLVLAAVEVGVCPRARKVVE